MSCETERMERGYSNEAWEARRSDLLQHFEAFLAGKEIADNDGDKMTSHLFRARAEGTLLEIDDSYPRHNILISLDTGRTNEI